MAALARRINQACSNVPLHVRELANLPNTNHRERDLHRWINRQVWRGLLPQPYDFSLPMSSDGLNEYNGTHSCLLVHEAFSCLSEYPELFELMLKGPNLADFWKGCEGTPWYDNHPIPLVRSSPSSCVPVRIYGDDAGVFENQKVLILNWSSANVTSQLTLDNRIVFCAITYLRLTDKSLDEVYKVLQWSMHSLALGVFPDRDHEGKLFSPTYNPERFRKAGRPLTGNGDIGVFSELLGDWKWQVEAIKLEYYYATNYICHRCRASRKIRRLVFTQYKRNSRLRRTKVSTRRFREYLIAQGVNRSWLTRIIGFCIDRCLVDAMHNLDLGNYQTLVPCCIIELVSENVWEGDSAESKFLAAHADYSDWCRLEKIPPCPRWSAAMRKANDCPMFTAYNAKAAMTRHLMRWLYTVLLRPNVSVSDIQLVRLRMFAQWNVFETICKESGRYFTAVQLARVQEAVEAALVAQNTLNANALANGSFHWHQTPKCHMATHMAYDDCLVANPRTVHCYCDEDLVGKMKRTIAKCHGGTAGRMGTMRYVILAGTRWWSRLVSLRGLGIF